jgi:prepilin-type processing-associated H-X9-DG protein
MNTQAMALPKRLRQFYRAICTNRPRLIKPQAKTLALWSDAILHTGTCGLTTVATYAALLLRQPQNTRRQRLREFYKDAWKRAVLPYLKSTQVWLILLTETRVNYPDLGGWTLTQELTLRSGVVSGKGLLQSHRGGVNWVFCDGSAKWLKVAATCLPRQRWTPYERARNLVEEYR